MNNKTQLKTLSSLINEHFQLNKNCLMTVMTCMLALNPGAGGLPYETGRDGSLDIVNEHLKGNESGHGSRHM